MNPITKELESLNFNWNSRLGAYIYGSNANIVIQWDEVKGMKLARLKKFASQKIKAYKKEGRIKNSSQNRID